MLIKIGDDTYPLVRPERLSLLDLLMLERETRVLGRPLTMRVLQAMQRDIDAAVAKGATDEEQRLIREEHPDGPWMLAVMLWGSQRAAGRKVSFEEAISFPIVDLDFVSEVDDEPEEAANPTPALPASGQGDEPQAAPKPKKTSKQRSGHA